MSKPTATANSNRGSDKLILGIVLAVVTFWLFVQTTLNITPTMRADLRITESLNNISVSITALFSGIFIVVAGGLADRIGRMKMTYVGLALSILGSLLIAISPVGTAVFLMAGRIIQGLSAACIMPATLALLKAYFDGAAPPISAHLLIDCCQTPCRSCCRGSVTRRRHKQRPLLSKSRIPTKSSLQRSAPGSEISSFSLLPRGLRGGEFRRRVMPG